MSSVRFTIPEVDVLAECLEGCGWSGYGDSAVDAFIIWWTHRNEVHPDISEPETPPAEVESPTDVPPKPTD